MTTCVICKEIKSCGNFDEDKEFICEDCDGGECGCCEEKLLNEGCGDIVNRGCCSNGDCNQEPPIEALCGSCGTWDEEDEVWRCPDCQEEHENEKWDHDALVLELNHGNCENDGRHPKTNDEDWALFLEAFIRPISYSEDKYRRLEKRLQERCHRNLVRGDPMPCETCKKPVWSNNDVFQKVHGCIVCQDCFDENEKDHEPPEPDGDGSGDE